MINLSLLLCFYYVFFLLRHQSLSWLSKETPNLLFFIWRYLSQFTLHWRNVSKSSWTLKILSIIHEHYYITYLYECKEYLTIHKIWLSNYVLHSHLIWITELCLHLRNLKSNMDTKAWNDFTVCNFFVCKCKN